MNTKGKVSLAIKYIETIMHERNASGEARLPPERVMAEMLGVSRPTVREAIQRLSSRGKLKIKQGSGIYIIQDIKPDGTALPWQQLLPEDEPPETEVSEFRLMHACLISRLAAKNATDEGIAGLGEIFSDIRHAADEQDFEGFAKLSVGFREAVIEAARNSMLSQFVRKFRSTVLGHIEQHIVQAFEVAPERDIWLLEFALVHESLYLAISKRAPNAAEQATIRYFDFLNSMPEHHGK